MEDLSLHILDIVENSLAAKATRVEIRVVENPEEDLLTIEVADNGEGMDEEARQKATDPFVTSRTTRRVGLGLPLLAEAARSSGGNMTIRSGVGKGTAVKATFQYSHIDRKPWGSMVETLVTLIVGNPDVDFFYQHRRKEFEYSLDTREVKRELGEVPINHPGVLEALRKNLADNLRQIGIR